LKKIVELTKKVTKPESSSSYPKSMDTKAKRALFDNLNKDESLANKINTAILSTKKDGWKGNKIKEREVKNAIRKFLSDENELDRIFEIVKNQSDY
jgi:type I restriction enzyme, R subunit